MYSQSRGVFLIFQISILNLIKIKIQAGCGAKNPVCPSSTSIRSKLDADMHISWIQCVERTRKEKRREHHSRSSLVNELKYNEVYQSWRPLGLFLVITTEGWLSPRPLLLPVITFSFVAFLFCREPRNNFLFIGTVPTNIILFFETVPMNKF